jgi:tRNA(Arg) A34 adenosine deaminase TadA
MNKQFIERAIGIAAQSAQSGGGPFGAVIVKDGRIVAESSNSVTRDLDPSAHAEVNAIRAACKKLGTYNLQGCEIYASCEPCPMCLGAIYWARLSGLYFAATRRDAEDAGFDDDFIYQEFAKDPARRTIPTERLIADSALRPFEKWKESADKKEY